MLSKRSKRLQLVCAENRRDFDAQSVDTFLALNFIPKQNYRNLVNFHRELDNNRCFS